MIEGDDFGKQFGELVKKAEKVLSKLPLIAANTGNNFFQGRFKEQAWADTTTQPWKRRKKGSKRDSGRAILTDTGRGKRSIRVLQADWSQVAVGINDPTVAVYMGAHNAGFRGTVQVHGFTRIATRKVGTKVLKLKGRQRRERIGGRKVKIQGASHQVNAHSRKVNLPKRQFIGNSAVLNRQIEREFILQLKNI